MNGRDILNFELKIKPHYCLYLNIFIFIFIALHLFVLPDALDITRYYESTEYDSRNFNNLLDFIVSKFIVNLDFIYFTTLAFAYNIGLSLNIVTTLYMSIYYISIFEILRNEFKKLRVNKIVLFFILMCAPFIWILSISRTTAAIGFFYLGMLFLNQNRIRLSISSFLISMFTHISMILPILILIVSIYSRKIKLSKRTVIIILIAILALSRYIPTFFIDIIAMIAGGFDSRYSYYSTIESYSVFSTDSIGYGDLIPITIIYIYAIYLLLKAKLHDLYFWILFILTCLLSFFIQTSLMMTNRIIMIMPLFIGWTTLTLLKHSSKTVKYQVFIICLLGTASILAHFWAYRTAFKI